MCETGTGHQQDAQACYERALQVSPSELWPHQGFVRSLMEMGQLNMALLHTTGILADKYVCDGGRVLEVMGLTWFTPHHWHPGRQVCVLWWESVGGYGVNMALHHTTGILADKYVCDGGKMLEVMELMPSRQVCV